jgi:hypothetical protein
MVQAILAKSAGFLKPTGETRGPNLILLVAAAIIPRVTQHSGEVTPLSFEVEIRWSERKM